ncbi:hypothetical protein EGS97_28510 [Klebsiella pneumoniae]|nr:hypothetical protein EGS97_28510 [Klebsiella pneumoniae]
MFAGKKSAQIREILISESAWEEMTCLFAPSLGMEVLRHSGYTITREDLLVAATLLAQNLFTHGYALGKL